MLNELNNILKLSWSKETCVSSLKDYWNKDNSSLGQCAITSLIVNDFLGGKIMRCMTSFGSHYYNMINNKIIDLAKEKFKDESPNYDEGQERTREYLLSNEDTKERYLTLLKIVKDNFLTHGKKEYKIIDSNNKEHISKIPGTLGGNKKIKTYGKLDCYSALYWISKGYYIYNRVFFDNEKNAIEAGYRPCAKCMKKEYKDWKKSKL